MGGTAYWFTRSTLLVRLRAGVAVSSEDVFANAQTMSRSDWCVPPAPVTGWVASSAALELRKYSVPPASMANEEVAGDWAGQTVKPGCLGVSALGRLTAPKVSRWVTFTVAAPDASWALEKA